MSSRSRIAPAALWLGALAAPLSGQSSQYIAPGSLAAPLVDRREAVESARDAARWRWGPLRVEPWLALRELTWVESGPPDGESEGDVTATAGAGLHAYLPVGAHATVAAQVLPEYIWWRERTEDRRLAGRYGLGLFVFPRRATIEVVARANDGDEWASSELDRRVGLEEREVEARIDVPVGGAFGVFARGEAFDVDADDPLETPDPGERVDALDRDERWWVAGVRWKPRRSFLIGVGAGRSQARFEQAPDGDNDGSSIYGELLWRRPKFELAAHAFDVELEAADGSAFPGYDDPLGEARARWTPRDRFSWSLYAQRGLTYSVEAGQSYYVDRRWGTEVSFRPGSRTSLALFVERGDHRYAGSALAAARVDDVESEGASGELRFGRGFALSLAVRRTRIDDGGAGDGTEFGEVRGGLTFGAGAPGVF